MICRILQKWIVYVVEKSNETVHPQITYRLLVRQGQIKIILKEIISN